MTGLCYLQDWILDQLLQSTAPVHTVMVELLQAFARSCIGIPGKTANAPLNETALMVCLF